MQSDSHQARGCVLQPNKYMKSYTESATEHSVVFPQVLSGKKKMALLPGDRENLAIQTRGGPEKHEVTGWVLVSSG